MFFRCAALKKSEKRYFSDADFNAYLARRMANRFGRVEGVKTDFKLDVVGIISQSLGETKK